MPGGQLITVLLSLLVLVAVPLLTSRQLRHRKGRWALVALSAVVYLLLGNLLSRVLFLGIVYPRDVASSGLTVDQLELRQFLHAVLSLGSAAVVTILAFAAVRRVVPRAGAPAETKVV